MCTFDEVFGFKSAELMKCLQGRSLTQFATKNIGCFVYELNRESDYTDKNNVLLFVQECFKYQFSMKMTLNSVFRPFEFARVSEAPITTNVQQSTDILIILW